MKIKILIPCILAALLSSILYAETIIQCPAPNEPLDQKWEWARKEAHEKNLQNGFWIGYSVQRLMDEKEYFVTGTRLSFDGVRADGKPSLEELTTGKKGESVTENVPDDQKVRQAAKNTLDDLEDSRNPKNKVLKDLAILFEFHSIQGTAPDNFAMLNTSLTMELNKRPLIWLGKADDGQSLALLMQTYQKINSSSVKEDLLYTIAYHQNSAIVLPFLRQILLGNSPDSLRAAAAQSIGSHGAAEAIPLLVQVCKTDPSSEVREQALYGLAEIDTPTARAAVIDLAKTANDAELREAAIYQITEDASPGEISIVKGILMKDPNQEVQEAALYALAELPDTTSLLIQVAHTHPNSELREAALYALAENASNEAVAALASTAKSDRDQDLQVAAMYALAELPGGKGIPFLIDIAKTHPDKDMRIQAIEALGNSDSAQAKAALLKLVSED